MREFAGNGIHLSCTKESLRNAEKIGKGVNLVNKKIILTISGCMMMTAVVSADNPFTDVPQDSWAYQSVTELANSGIVEGMDGKNFQGNRNITRYEAAQMVARALAREDGVRGEEREKIQKLAEEFSEELNGLGVRVDDLENRVGNIKLSGDIRVRYLHEKDAGKYGDRSWQFRGRLRAEGKINEKISAILGVNFWDNFNTTQSASSGSDTFYVDRAYITYRPDAKKRSLFTVGRFDYAFGNNRALQYYETFDGLKYRYQTDKGAFTAGYGKFKEGRRLLDSKAAFAEVEKFFKNGSVLGLYYTRVNGLTDERSGHVWGGYTNIVLGKKWQANYELYRVDRKDESTLKDGTTYIATVKYGKADFTKPGSWDLWGEYLHAAAGTANDDCCGTWRMHADDTKGWGIGLDYTLAKNAQIQLFRTFDTKVTSTGNKRNELTRAQFIFLF